MTFKIDVHTPGGKKDGSVELPAELFDVEPNIALMHQVVTAQLAAKRQAPESAGSLQIETPTFALTLVSVIVILTVLQFMPALVLGPIADHLSLGLH